MHGLRALRDVLDNVITQDGNNVTLNLYFEGRWQGKDAAVGVERAFKSDLPGSPAYHITLEGASVNFTARQAEWMAGKTMNSGKDTPTGNAVIDVQPTYAVRLMERDGTFHSPGNVITDKPKEVAVFCGPWLMGIDAAFNPMYHGEPFDNTLLMADDKTLASQVKIAGDESPLLAGPHIEVAYMHSGFSDLGKVSLRPVSEQASHEPETVAFWHKVKKAN